MKRTINTMAINAMVIIALLLIAGCAQEQVEEPVVEVQQSAEQQAEDASTEKPYSADLERRIAGALSEEERVDIRPDYLPVAMFSRLPPFPDDFYRIRNLIKAGRVTDLGSMGPEYWQQPEFFPNFEEIGVPLLQHPPEGRWGAYGIATYPADSVGTIVAGESLDLYFFIKSNYLVETYQGVNFVPVIPSKASITTGVELPDGSKSVEQDPEVVNKHFTIDVSPNPFVLEPNFPVYNINGTRRIKVTLTTTRQTPPGNYMIGLDTGTVPEEQEQEWLMQYLNLYTSGGMTKIERPYYQAFITVVRGEK